MQKSPFSPIVTIMGDDQEKAIVAAERYCTTTASMDWGEYRITHADHLVNSK
ncbi:hypothetical protein ABEW34_05725 [Paenibacillus algorifonticola]|uniref:hypothetical protein n=1 Tax=Paenibacillus algorifonticola TaxID=684063 RepID=UPI003D29A2B9